MLKLLKQKVTSVSFQILPNVHLAVFIIIWGEMIEMIPNDVTYEKNT